MTSSIISAELEGGQSPLDSRDGAPAVQSSRRRVRVSRSPSRARAKRKKTTAISGPTFSDCLTSADPVLSSVSRWLQNLASRGSMEYVLTLKVRITPSGRVIPALRASTPRTSDSDCSGWPSPATQNANGGENPQGNTGEHFTLQTAAGLTGWPTPDAHPEAPNTGTRRENGRIARRLTQQGLGPVAQLTGWPTARAEDSESTGAHKTPDTLTSAARLTGWATPQVHDQRGGKTPEQIAAMKDRTAAGVCNLNEQCQLAGWPSPMAGSLGTDEYNQAGNTDATRLTIALAGGPVAKSEMARVEGWPTPNAMAGESTSRRHDRKGEMLSNQVAHGGATTSPTAETERRGVLEPAFSRWLQAFPESWDRYSPCFNSWDMVQRMLSVLHGRLDPIALQDFAVTEMRSASPSQLNLFEHA
jgi:hypothetical protein